MGLITEASLRAEIKNKSMYKYFIKPGTKITPSAMQFLRDRKIELIIEEQNTENIATGGRTESKKENPPAEYIFADTVCYMDKKPEYMTQLYGKKLVYKNHPRIVFRGAIDSLQSRILLLQAEAAENKQDKLVKELVSYGLMGIEADYEDNTNDDTGNLLRLAIKYDLLATGGSDYHGSLKPAIEIGRGRGNLKIPYEILDKMKTGCI